ncbi:hypothetical protein [Streptomyces sp. NBC_00448]|uniref:hypothetical protein n=1 Tax=Streptomyces sp. NBC_00448 TaxID=2903652 RepID=UPI002E245EEF
MQALKASWGDWMAAFQQRYDRLPRTAPDARCPNCGARELNLTFCGLPADRVGYASFWCDGCLTGIHLSRCAVPDDVPMDSVHTPVEQRTAHTPNYVLVWPTDEDE